MRETSSSYSPLVHGVAVVLTLSVFPLIWVGGLVTTYDAGMAVPDWPGTYGYNLFLYPPETWLSGPFDLFVEHSHRLLGALAGFLSIGLVAAAWRYDTRPWFRTWTVWVLIAVIVQGILGGLRVRMDARTLAMIHGCTGPLFFAIATSTAVMSSRLWIERTALSPQSASWVPKLASIMVVASYLQLIVGAQMRHVTGLTSHRVFMGFVHTHLTLAAMVAGLAIALLFGASMFTSAPRPIARPTTILALLVLVQIGLGLGTWIVNYALPWSEITEGLARYTISAKGYWESLIVTAHMATGSLIISVSTMVSLRSWRLASVQGIREGAWLWKKQLA